MSTIAIFHPSADLYGSDRILANTLGAMPDKLHKKVYLLSNGPLVAHLYEKVCNVEVQICPEMPVMYRKIFTFKGIFLFFWTWLKFLVFIKREQKQYNFKTAYVNTLSNAFLLPILKAMNIPSFIHVHEIVVKPKLIGKVTAFLANRYAKHVVCVSQAVADNLIKYTAKISRKTVVIHNGIDAIKVACSEKHEHLSFYLFGRIMPQKGHWLVVEALANLPHSKLEKTTFTFMGGVLYNQTELLSDLKAKIKEVGLENVIVFKPFEKYIESAMSEADVCLIPSTILDSFPTTVLEAMSAEKLVIATNQGGAKEAIIDKRTGILFEHNDANALAKSIEAVIDSPSLTKSLGKEAKQHFNKLFTLERYSTNWNAFLIENRLY
ncbi:MAG: glycosyltransferase family 4 protein [Putridiphycobacter sp.]|nr:glycosyltransferase family 4 protein [Putridiphycobacter sp.]